MMPFSLRNIVILVLVSVPLPASVAQPGEAGDAVRKTLYLIVRSEITIDRPVKVVWPHFLDMSAWMADIRFQSVKGKPGEEGEVRLVASTKDAPYQSYFIESVRITPYEQYVVRVTPENGTAYSGFADFSFTEANGKTNLIYDVYIESEVSVRSEQEFRQLSEERYRSGRRTAAGNNQNLKSLVEGKRQISKPAA